VTAVFTQRVGPSPRLRSIAEAIRAAVSAAGTRTTSWTRAADATAIDPSISASFLSEGVRIAASIAQIATRQSG
jgi:hypothetical protein